MTREISGIVVAVAWLLVTPVVAENDVLRLAGFESDAELLRWEKLRFPVQKEHQQFAMALDERGATEGRRALRVHQPLAKQRIAVGLSEGLPRDWSGYTYLRWDVRFLGEAPAGTSRIRVAVTIDDAYSNGDWKDNFNRGFFVRKGGTAHCWVPIHEVATRIDVRKIRQVSFSYSGAGPTTFYLDNIRLTGPRAEPLRQGPIRQRVHLPVSGCVWILGDDFARLQIVADGYYEPKGLEPSNDQVARMPGLTFRERSERAGSYEKAEIGITLARDVKPAQRSEAVTAIEAFDKGARANVPGRFGAAMRVGAGNRGLVLDPAVLNRVQGTIAFWVRPERPTVEQFGMQMLVHARKDLRNQLRIGFWGGDLFFEIRVDGERHIVRHWSQTIWGDIRKATVRWRAGLWHHVRCQWGPEGMYLYVDDQELAYNVFMLHRKPEDEPAPTPYTGPLPEGLSELVVGSDCDGQSGCRVSIDDVVVTKNARRGSQWTGLPYVRSGTMTSKTLDRGARFADPQFRLGTFQATARTPKGTAVTFAYRAHNGSLQASPAWHPIRPGEAFADWASDFRYLQVQARLSTADPLVTPELDEYHVIQFNPPHPRVFLTKDQIEKIRVRCAGKLKPLFEQFKGLVDKGLRGKYPPVGHTECAFLYSITGERRYLDAAKRRFDAALKGKRKPNETWDMVGLDWILGDCTAGEKREYLQWAIRNLDRGMPRDAVWWNQMYNSWRHPYHHAFIRNMILFGEEGSGDVHRVRRSFHSYEDYMKTWMIPAFNETGGVWPEAFGYHSYTNQGPVLSLEAWTTATGENVWPQAQWVKDLGAWYFYCMRPYQHRTIAVNDDRGGVSMLMGPWVNLLASRLNDPFCQHDAAAVLKRFAGANNLRPRVGPYGYRHMLYWLLWHDPDVATPDLSKTPTDRFFPGDMGWVSMRGDWSKDATLGVFLWNDWYGGHKQADTGAFQVHKGAELAIDPPDSRRIANEMHFRYRMKSVAHNVLLVSEPGAVNSDGGQHRPSFPGFGDVVDDSLFDTARPLAFQSTPDYCWTACDLSGAYRPDRFGLDRQVAAHVRQVVFLKPDTFVLVDYVKLTDAKYRRAWLLHSYEKPEVPGTEERKGDTVSLFPAAAGPLVIRRGTGKLRVWTLLPKAARITRRAMDGKGRDGKVNPKARIWQIEIDPAGKPADETVFVHVLHAAQDDAGKTPECEALAEPGQSGARVRLGDTVWEVLLDSRGGCGGRLTRRHATQPLRVQLREGGVSYRGGGKRQ